MQPAAAGGNSSEAGATSEPGSGGTPGAGGSASTGSGGTSAQGGAPASGGSAGMTGGMGNTNLLSNGDFAQGEAHWKVESHNGGGVSLSSSGQFCVKARGELVFTIGYPGPDEPGVALKAGSHYVFSFRARASAATEGDTKVGEVTEPYSAATLKRFTFGNSFQTYTQEFDQLEGLGMMGLAFTSSLPADQEFCLDDVSLTEKP